MVWSHIILEGFCTYKFASKKTWKCFDVDFKNGKMEFKDKEIKCPNPNYIPKSERPKWCIKQNKKTIPQFRCMCGKKKCPFFGYTNAERSDYKYLDKKYKEERK